MVQLYMFVNDRLTTSPILARVGAAAAFGRLLNTIVVVRKSENCAVDMSLRQSSYDVYIDLRTVSAVPKCP